jgi:hypothetical protein
MVGDHMRRMSRQQREDAILSHDSESRAGLADWSMERPLLRGVGMVGTSGTNRRYPHAKPRSRAHGAAAMPPTPEAAELLASGNVESTVLCIAQDGTETIRTVAEIRSRGKNPKNRAPVAATARTVDTARVNHHHDFNS